MLRKIFSFCTKTPSVTVVFLLLFTFAGSAATDFFSSGRIVVGTPFDGKVRQAGCLNLPSSEMSSYAQQSSIEQLFMQARSFRYASDGRTDVWQSAEETQTRRAGDCEDKAIWLFTRLIQNGYYNVRLVIGRHRTIDSQLHVWVICSDKQGNTCLLDPTVQKRIWYLTAIDSGFYQPLYAYDGQQRYRYFSSRR